MVFGALAGVEKRKQANEFIRLFLKAVSCLPTSLPTVDEPGPFDRPLAPRPAPREVPAPMPGGMATQSLF